MKTFLTAFRLSLPVLGAYLFLGITYGMLAFNMDYPLWVPILMAMVVYSGSVEFLALTILAGRFAPIASVVVALTVGARHFFYAISMLGPWKHAGRLKPLLIYLMADEAFAINYANRGSFRQQFYVSILDYVYWVSGALVGYVAAAMLPATVMDSLQGLDFVLTAMFVAIFMDDFIKSPVTRRSGWLGIVVTAVAVALFGPQYFIVPTMATILLALYIAYRKTIK